MGCASLVVAEYVPTGKRGLYTSIPEMGVMEGFLFSMSVFAAVSALPYPQFVTWGGASPSWLSPYWSVRQCELSTRLRPR